jgi:GNAT superfamily N-acetyltransferase
MQINEMSPRDLGEVARLCDQELVLDRYAGSIPGILTRRPHLGLVASYRLATIGACIGSVSQDDDGKTEGFIDLLVVDRASQRQGFGRQLAAAMEQQLVSRGCERISITGNDPYYAWPGIDIHYTAAVCFAEDLGYRRQGCEVNMNVDLLRAPPDTEAAESRLRSEGIEVRPARAGDDGPMQESLRTTWRPTWITELTAALRRTDSGLEIAVQDTRYVGFCAHGLNRPHEVGPAGTTPDRRRLGIGAVLLKRCLASQRDRGLTAAELVWAGPLSYFSRTLDATIGRAFWLYSRDLAATAHAPDWRDRVGLL